MVAKRCLAVSFAVGLLGCAGTSQPAPASEASAPPPATVAPASVTPPPGAAPAAVARGDDPKACLDPNNGAEEAWRDAARQKLDEKLPALERCASGGRVKREERLDLMAEFSASGEWLPTAGARTTLAECRVFECVAKELSTTRVEAWPHGRVPRVSFDFLLSPSAPPRRALPTDPPLSSEATACGSAIRGDVSGRLEPEVIQKVVRSNYSNFRACYEEGLGRNPKLQGRVGIRFVIERDGHVTNVSIVDNTLPDCKVARCVRDHYPKFEFPKPEGGIVTVVYPIMLEPG